MDVKELPGIHRVKIGYEMDDELPTIAGVKETLGDRYTKEIEWAWPDVPPSIFPCGNRILVQLRTPPRLSRGGIILADESKTMEQARAQTAMDFMLGNYEPLESEA